jgi:hypothetical protein
MEISRSSPPVTAYTQREPGNQTVSTEEAAAIGVALQQSLRDTASDLLPVARTINRWRRVAALEAIARRPAVAPQIDWGPSETQ